MAKNIFSGVVDQDFLPWCARVVRNIARHHARGQSGGGCKTAGLKLLIDLRQTLRSQAGGLPPRGEPFGYRGIPMRAVPDLGQPIQGPLPKSMKWRFGPEQPRS